MWLPRRRGETAMHTMRRMRTAIVLGTIAACGAARADVIFSDFGRETGPRTT